MDGLKQDHRGLYHLVEIIPEGQRINSFGRRILMLSRQPVSGLKYPYTFTFGGGAGETKLHTWTATAPGRVFAHPCDRVGCKACGGPIRAEEEAA